MFSTVVSWAVFAVTSMILVAVAYEFFRTKSESEQALEKLEEYLTGKRTKISAIKVLVLFAIWFAAGMYLLG